MAGDSFHREPFDEGTLTKLDIFQLYTREWLPVFLSREQEFLKEVHLFDFFSGPGTDSSGVSGSPLRTLATLKEYSSNPILKAWGKVGITAHFSDAALWKSRSLKALVESPEWQIPGVKVATERAEFSEAFAAALPVLRARDFAKLLLIDQYGVSHVTPEVFRQLVSFPCTDFLFFISSTTLQRFREHPSIQHKIRPADDFNQVHHAVLTYYREMLPVGEPYYLAPFSIKKGSNIYGLIFGSRHPKGIDKFLSVAWDQDRLNGNANFDINRDEIAPGELMLDLGTATRPLKINAFEAELEKALSERALANEVDVMDLCFKHGVRRTHARPVLEKLRKEGVIEIDFQVPSVDNLKSPRLIRYL